MTSNLNYYEELQNFDLDTRYHEGVRLSSPLDLDDVKDGKGGMIDICIPERNEDEAGLDNFDVSEVCNEDILAETHGVVDEDEEESDPEVDEIPPFVRKAKTMEDISGDGGVMKKLLEKGTGCVVDPSSMVEVDYNAYLEYQDGPFDSTYLRAKSFSFKMGTGSAVPGLDVAVSTMRKDELSQFLFKPEYYLGPKGVPPRIPPNATVMFEVRLKNFTDRAERDEYYSLSHEDRKSVSIELVKQVCETYRKEGKNAYQARRFRGAIQSYRRAICVLEDKHLQDEEDEREVNKLLLGFNSNLALCYVQEREASAAIKYANEAIRIDGTAPKPHYLRGRALIQQGDFDRARESLKKANSLAPKDKDIRKALVELEKKAKNMKSMEKDFCRKMFAGGSLLSAEEESQAQKREEEREACANTEAREGFKGAVTKIVEEFVNIDEDLQTVAIPSPRTPGDVDFVVDIAGQYGLDISEEGTGQNLKMILTKP